IQYPYSPQSFASDFSASKLLLETLTPAPCLSEKIPFSLNNALYALILLLFIPKTPVYGKFVIPFLSLIFTVELFNIKPVIYLLFSLSFFSLHYLFYVFILYENDFLHLLTNNSLILLSLFL